MIYLSEAEDPTTTPERLAKLAKLEDWEVRRAVAYNPTTSADTLGFLAVIGNDRVTRVAVADSPNTWPDTLTYLAYCPERFIRAVVAANPNTPAETLAFLARDYDGIVRAIAQRERLSRDLMSPPSSEELMSESIDNGYWCPDHDQSAYPRCVECFREVGE